MENEFTDFLNQNWNEKYKAGVTSSSLHLTANGAPNTSTLNQAVLQQYHQQSLRGTNSSSSSSSSSSANYENIRLAFMQHNRHQSTSAAQIAQHATTSAAAAAAATVNSTLPIQRNPSTTAACPKLIDIHSIKGNNVPLPFDCQSKLNFFYCFKFSFLHTKKSYVNEFHMIIMYFS